MPFHKVINPKVNVIAWLEFELAYFEAAIQHVSHYTTKIDLYFLTIIILLKNTNSEQKNF